MKYICILLFLIFGCSTKKSSQYLEVYYLGPNISTPMSYPCGMIADYALKDDLNYKKIDDEINFKKINTLCNRYEKVEDTTGIDARIKVIIHNEGKVDTLCLGEYFNTYKNGVKVKDDKEMLDLIKKLIDYENTIPSFIRKHPERYGIKK